MPIVIKNSLTHPFLGVSFAPMNAFEHIRRVRLKLSQREMAALTGVHQSTVSKWENGYLAPGFWEMLHMRECARERGLPWEDRWFFESMT